MWRLFIVDFYWSRSIGGGGWRIGLLMMLCGVLLVGVAIAFGGGSVQGQRFGNVNPLLRSFFSKTGNAGRRVALVPIGDRPERRLVGHGAGLTAGVRNIAAGRAI